MKNERPAGNWVGGWLLFEYKKNLRVRDIVEELKIPIKEISIIILDHFDSTPDIMLDREVKESSLIHLFPPMAGG